MRTLAVAALLATSAGAQVMAGVDGGMSTRLVAWLTGTVIATGVAGLLASAVPLKKEI
ncbi:hypothetical protein [Umezawaea sp. Da 62-37]|uniref:hypothetical protein n=1 Tax=Umezawaea sp. Da 62-37 TaxID=3075927 RepID=UPI0028F6D1DC|nr:hypothetical protein [Umezawaea sp. Da 62-37]WNV86576.1 hypothetical protein RM788_52110 [Umezawaea sp. Da 62-37]